MREPFLYFEEKHQPMALPQITVLADNPGEVQIGSFQTPAKFFLRLATGAGVGRFADVGVQLAAAGAPEAAVGFLRAFEQEHFIALVEAIKQRRNAIRKFRNSFRLRCLF